MPVTQISSQTRAPSGTTDSIVRIKDELFGYEQARHLLLRGGFGGTDEQIHTLAQWGPEKAVDQLVNYDQIPSEADSRDAFDDDIIRPLTPEERQELNRARQSGDEDTVDRYRTQQQRQQREDRKQMREIQQHWLTRMVQTPRPLEEKLTLFWHGHFATSYRIVEDSYHMYAQNRMLRASAMGSLSTLLTGIIRDPAMLRYLNNNQNRKNSPNENLARELLELFSLGEGNYTERDIKEAARTLTGFTYEDNAFTFNTNQHDQGSKMVLGVHGNIDGNSLVSAILNQEACALFIVLKLYRFFVRDIPMDLSAIDTGSRKVILKLAHMLRQNNYELRPVIRTLLLSQHFYDPLNMGSKIKSPTELLVGAIRSLRVPVRDMSVVAEAMDLMGQSLYTPPSVKGWDGGRSWINTSTMFIRQNTLIYLLTGMLPTKPRFLADKFHFDARMLVPSLNTPDDSGVSDEQVVRELTRFTLGTIDDETVGSVLMGARGDLPEGTMQKNDAVVRALVLLTSMPEYQLC